jgi:hypothetical protein
MKLVDILLLGLALVFIIIGIDQSLVYGFQKSYWAFMLSLTLFFAFNLRRNRKKPEAPDSTTRKPPSENHLPESHPQVSKTALSIVFGRFFPTSLFFDSDIFLIEITG